MTYNTAKKGVKKSLKNEHENQNICHEIPGKKDGK